MNIHAQDDEEQIRALVSTWMSATNAGDTDTVFDLMADGREEGRWLLFRDANLIAPVQPSAGCSGHSAQKQRHDHANT